MQIADIPADDIIRTLDLGALLSLRSMMVPLTGHTANYLTTYDEVLLDTLAIAALLTGRAKHEETLPPEPAWVADLETDSDDLLNDPIVEHRIMQLISHGLDDEDIWETIRTDFNMELK